MGFGLDEFLTPLRRKTVMIAWIGLSLAAALLGPFGTYGALDLPRRMELWFPLVGAVALIGVLVRSLLRRLAWPTPGRRAALATAVTTALAASPLLAGVIGRVGPVPAPSAIEIAATIFFAMLALCAVAGPPVRAVTAAPPADTPPPLPGAAPPAPMPGDGPRLMRRLDPAIRAPLVSLSVRDHYVDVVTDAGRSTLLLRLSDAITECEGVEGLQIHRSHWVARRAARQLLRQGSRVVLETSDGSRLPVSRAQRARLEAWGLPGTAIPAGRRPPDLSEG